MARIATALAAAGGGSGSFGGGGGFGGDGGGGGGSGYGAQGLGPLVAWVVVGVLAALMAAWVFARARRLAVVQRLGDRAWRARDEQVAAAVRALDLAEPAALRAMARDDLATLEPAWARGDADALAARLTPELHALWRLRLERLAAEGLRNEVRLRSRPVALLADVRPERDDLPALITLRLSVVADDAAVTRIGKRVPRREEHDLTVVLVEHWTYAATPDGWRLAWIETAAEGAYHLGRALRVPPRAAGLAGWAEELAARWELAVDGPRGPLERLATPGACATLLAGGSPGTRTVVRDLRVEAVARVERHRRHDVVAVTLSGRRHEQDVASAAVVAGDPGRRERWTALWRVTAAPAGGPRRLVSAAARTSARRRRYAVSSSASSAKTST